MSIGATAQQPGASLMGVTIIGLLAGALAFGILFTGPLAILGIFGLLAFMAFLSYPVVGLYITTALLLLQGSAGVLGIVNETAPVAITLAQITGLAAITAWGASVLVRKLPVHYNFAVVLIVLFVLWSLLATIVSEYTREEFPHWARLATRLAFFLLAINLLSTVQRFRTYVWIVLACTLIMCGVAVLQYFLPQMQVAGATAWTSVSGIDAAYIDQESLQGEAAIRVSGRAGHSNWLAMIILLTLPLFVYGLTRLKHSHLKLLLYAGIGVALVALILTYTRTGFMIGMVLAVLLLSKRMMHFTPLRVFGLMFALVIAWTLVPGAYKERVLSPQQYRASQSVESRVELQEAAARYWMENPVFGLGIGGFGLNFIRENNETASVMLLLVRVAGWEEVFIGTHNMYLQLLCDSGTVGFLLFVWFYALMFREVMRAEDRYKRNGDTEGKALASALFVSLFGFAICAVFLHALHQHIWWIVAAAAVALTLHRLDFRTEAQQEAAAENEDSDASHTDSAPLPPTRQTAS